MQKLDSKWVIWQNSNEDSSVKSWSDDLKNVGEFSEVSEFNYFMNEISKINITNLQSINVFKENIKPMWEDPKNMNGGRLIIDIPASNKHEVENIWKHTVAFCISNSVEGICGCVFVEKQNLYKISIWIESSEYQESVKENWQKALVRFDVSIYFLMHKKNPESNKTKKFGSRRK